ncbi:Flp family type IVb pilin [Caulobacter sp. 17J65-9]|uniref:Flp family type IVb pilin n=1 Tax=Caulobacter sp. 17J65-9 TaxID=2709382 RepID=UPI0013C91E06|nr:Flp family type IVb pilin [Caulobacter sp. 17J65-9]NEX93977.1 Flp family type IVb pilin [Caulobacter sp. 17J65-9]
MARVRVLKRFLKNERGATAIEYGLILALMFLAILGAVQLFTTRAVDIFEAASDAIVSATK